MLNILAILRWSLSLGAKFYRVVPFSTLTIVFLTLLSQISSLLSFFLPLKIVILLGSDKIPHYFPSAFVQLDRDILIAWMSVATVAFFLLSLISNKLIERATAVASGKLLAKSQKLALFENQDELAANGYQRYSSALAGGVFIVLALVALAWFYPSMASLITGYLASVFLFILSLYHLFHNFREYIKNKLAPTLSLASNVGFFLVFAYLVVEFLFFSPPGFIVAIISLIASRQIFGRAAAMVNGIDGLIQQKTKLDALFFHGKVLVSHQPKQGKKNIWDLLVPEKRTDWLLDVLQDAGVKGWSAEDLHVRWLVSSQPNIPHLLLTNHKNKKKYYFIKVYNTNRKSLALHEASLAVEMPKGIPMPELIYTTQLNDFHCHLYKLSFGRFLRVKSTNSEVQDLKEQLFSINLSRGLINRYLRSRPLLADRLFPDFLERLYIASRKPEDTLQINELIERLPEIKLQLKSLPLVLVNPEISRSIWNNKKERNFIVLNWDKWTLEPLGAGWLVSEKDLMSLSERIPVYSSGNKKPNIIHPESAHLSALLYELERLINKQQLLTALNLLPRILSRLSTLRKYNTKE